MNGGRSNGRECDFPNGALTLALSPVRAGRNHDRGKGVSGARHLGQDAHTQPR